MCFAPDHKPGVSETKSAKHLHNQGVVIFLRKPGNGNRSYHAGTLHRDGERSPVIGESPVIKPLARIEHRVYRLPRAIVIVCSLSPRRMRIFASSPWLILRKMRNKSAEDSVLSPAIVRIMSPVFNPPL